MNLEQPIMLQSYGTEQPRLNLAEQGEWELHLDRPFAMVGRR